MARTAVRATILYPGKTSLCSLRIYHPREKDAASKISHVGESVETDDEYYEVEKVLEVRLNKDFHSEEYKVRFKGYTSEDDMWLPSSAFKEPVTFETVSRRGRHRKHTMKGGLFGVDVQRSRQSKTPTTRAGCKRQHARDSNEGQFYVVVYSDHIPTILSCNFNLARNVSSECKKTG